MLSVHLVIAMAYKIDGLLGIAGILIARRAVGKGGYDRTAQKRFYEKMDSMLSPLEFSVRRLNPHGFFQPAEARCMLASKCLMLCKINDEPSDPQTLQSVDALNYLEKQWSSLATGAAAVALFNHRSTVQRFRTACSKQHRELGRLLQRKDVLDILDVLLPKIPLQKLFTRSFDRHATALPDADLVASRLKKVRQIGLKKLDGGLKGGRGGATASRRSLAMKFGTGLSPLLGRNAFAYLERYFIDRATQPGGWHGLPAWVQSAGTLMGEGALAGGNLIAGEVKNYNSHASTTGDLARGFENSTVSVKRLRRMLQEEVTRLEALQVSPKKRSMQMQLIKAGKELLASTHTEMEFLLCELAKIIEFARTTEPNRRYLREPPL